MSDPVSMAASVLDRAQAAGGHFIRIADRGPVGQVTLRGDLASAKLHKAVKVGVGVDVPGPLSAAFDGDRGAVWMSPDELLLLTEYDQAGALVTALGEALAGSHHMALDVSDARAVISLEGAQVADVLSKGAPLDMSAFPVGHARRTHVANVAVGIWRKSDSAWEIVCFRSFAKHLFDWLVISSREGSEL